MTEQMFAVSPENSSLQLPILIRLCQDESGQDLVEYALISLAIGLFTVVGVNGLADSIANDVNIVVGGFSAAVGFP